MVQYSPEKMREYQRQRRLKLKGINPEPVRVELPTIPKLEWQIVTEKLKLTDSEYRNLCLGGFWPIYWTLRETKPMNEALEEARRTATEKWKIIESQQSNGQSMSRPSP